jgi:probable O-glycosylation ligase (exosortase A-associated)
MNRSVEWWRPDVAVDRADGGEAPTAADSQIPDSAIPFWAMMTFTFILLFAPQAYFPALAPFRIALLTAIVAITTYLFDKFTSGQPVITRTREMWITAYLIAWAILTVPFSLRPAESASFLLEVYFKTLAIFWLLSHTVNTLARLRQVTWALMLMTVPMAATALDNFISGTFIPAVGVNRIVGYDAPLTLNPNGLALMLNLMLPLCVALFLGTTRPLVRALLLGIIGLDVTAVILTFSRGGFLTLTTTFAIYLWKSSKRPERSWAVAALVIALVCLPLLPSSYWDRVSTISNKDSDTTGSAQARWRDMLAAANLVVQNPIVGVGVGMNALALVEERGPAMDEANKQLLAVHNVYLVYAAELGIPGLVLFLMLLAGCMKSTISVQGRSAGVPALRELFYLAEGVQISLIAFAVAALFEPAAYHIYFYYMAGLAVAAKAVCGTVNPAHDQNQSALPLRKQL